MEKTAEIWKVFLTFFFFLGGGGRIGRCGEIRARWGTRRRRSQLAARAEPNTLLPGLGAAQNPCFCCNGSLNRETEGKYYRIQMCPRSCDMVKWQQRNSLCYDLIQRYNLPSPFELRLGCFQLPCVKRRLSNQYPSKCRLKCVWLLLLGCFLTPKVPKMGAKLILHREWEQTLGGGCEGGGGVFHPTVVRF